MPRFRSIVFLSLFVIVMASIPATAVYLLFSNTYTEFISWFLLRIHKPHLLKSASTFLSPQQFLLLRIVAVILAGSMLFLLFFTYKKREKIVERLNVFFNKSESVIVEFFKHLLPASKMHRGLFIFLIAFYLIRTTICIFYYPIDFDEADTYMLFSSQGPLVAATFYPLPNNHILFSIITSITSMLPINPVYALRLPLLPIGLLAIISMYGLLKKHFAESAALFGLSFFIAAYPVFVYSFLARGYLLLLLFYIITLYAIFEFCFSDELKKRHVYMLVLASVGGLYTIPGFLYALAGLFLFASAALLMQKKNAEIIRLFKNGSIIVLITAILYLPVLISVKWVLLKPYMTPVYERTNTLNAFITSFGYLSKTFLSPVNVIATLLGFCFLTGCIFLVRSNNRINKAVAGFMLTQLLLCLAVFFIFRQQFPPKPWMHFTVATAFVAAAIINLAIKRSTINHYVLLPAMILLLVGGTITSYRYKNESIVTGYNRIAKQCEQLLVKQNIKEVYTGIPYFKTMIDYYAIKNKLDVSLSNSRKRSTRYTPFDPQKRYDLIIISAKESKLPPLMYRYDTILQDNNTAVLLIRQ